MSEAYRYIQRGVVINNADPENRGRVIARIPTALGPAPSNWCEPAIDTSVLPPEVGEAITVMFANADPSKPVFFTRTTQPEGETRPSSEFLSISSNLNRVGKYEGRQVFDRDLDLPLWSSGPEDSAPWKNALGQIVHQPV